MHLGIDFGTTRTVVAACDRGNYPIVSFTNENGDLSEWYPSLIAEKDGQLRCGWKALDLASEPGWTLFRSFKRLLADGMVRPDHAIRLGSTTMPLRDVLALFLRSLREDLQSHSNMPVELRSSESLPVFISTPANAHGTQRLLTLDAFRKAGFQVLGLLNEPSAAGFEYAHRHRTTFTSKREHVLVYDLGGGTFDASLVRMSGQHHDVVCTAGVSRLGGDDFDASLAELVFDRMGKAPMDREEKPWGKLLDICREAKEGLTQNSRRILIDVESALGKQAPMPEVALPVSTFYEKCSELIEKTIQVMVPVLARDEVVDGGMGTLPGIAGIYVVGGASSLPAVGRSLRQRFGRRVHRSPYPSAATAIGLAIAGDRSAGYHLTDRFSRAFGVFRELRDGASISFDLVFTKDTRMPAVEEGMVVSTRTYRAAHNIGHFRYIECDTVDDKGGPAGNITPFAEVFFPFDPSLWEKKETLASETVRRLSSPGPLVEEQYTVDVDGIVEVRIRHLDGGYEQVFRLWE